MAAIKALLRLLSILFHLLLTLFLIAVCGVALVSGAHDLQFRMLPWTGSTLLYVLLGAALFGFLTVVLAVFGKMRFLFFLWSLAVAVFLVRGYFLTGYRFTPGEAARALYLTIASVAAILGAWLQMWRRRRRFN